MVRAWQIIIPDFGAVTGPFEMTSFELSGRHDGEVAFELTVQGARGRPALSLSAARPRKRTPSPSWGAGTQMDPVGIPSRSAASRARRAGDSSLCP